MGYTTWRSRYKGPAKPKTKPKGTLGGHFSVTKEPELTRPGATTAQNTKTGGMSTNLEYSAGAKKSSLNPTKRLRITQRIAQRIPAILDDLVEATRLPWHHPKRTQV